MHPTLALKILCSVSSLFIHIKDIKGAVYIPYLLKGSHLFVANISGARTRHAVTRALCPRCHVYYLVEQIMVKLPTYDHFRVLDV